MHVHPDALDEVRARVVALLEAEGEITLAPAARRARHLAQVRPGAARALRRRAADAAPRRRARAAPARAERRREQHVLAAVVADGVEPALGVQPGAQVAVGDHDPLLVVERPRDHLARRRLDDRRAAAPVDAVALDRHREVLRGTRARDVLRHETTNAPDSIATWRIVASQPSESSAVGATQICGPPR